MNSKTNNPFLKRKIQKQRRRERSQPQPQPQSQPQSQPPTQLQQSNNHLLIHLLQQRNSRMSSNISRIQPQSRPQLRSRPQLNGTKQFLLNNNMKFVRNRIKRQKQQQQQYYQEQRRLMLIHRQKLANIRNPWIDNVDINSQKFHFKIQTTDYLLNIAQALKDIFNNIGLVVSITNNTTISKEILENKEGVNTFYVFLCVGHMFHLPRESKYCIYNLEQVNYHSDFPLLGLSGERGEFINTAFKNATTIFDYSKMNITNYPEELKDKTLYLPIPLFDEKNPKVVSNIEKEYDVLFFGGLNDRRQKIMEYLKGNTDMNIRIVTNVFGEDLYDIIKKSHIVLNIHFKEKSLLETARIHDCIRQSNPLIISEESIDKDTMEEYKDIIKFVPIIKEDLSNISELIEEIQKLLSSGDVSYKRWAAEKNIHNRIKKRFDYFKIYKYSSLFHKYLLGISTPNKPITYELIQKSDDKIFNNNNLFAHLHCYDISKFNEIYSEYTETIGKYFNIVITYSIGENEIKNERFAIIKIPNKGMDIGAKFCMVQYLNDNNISYEYVFFLHSKSNQETRNKYFLPLILKLNNTFIKNIREYDGYFSDIQWDISDNKLKMISGNPQFANSNLPERNLLYRKDLLNYLGYENQTSRFVEGNIYIFI